MILHKCSVFALTIQLPALLERDKFRFPGSWKVINESRFDSDSNVTRKKS